MMEKLAVKKPEFPTASMDLMMKLRTMKVVPSLIRSRRPKRMEQSPVKKIPVLKTLAKSREKSIKAKIDSGQ